ncbi:hypothetical protein FEM48_ZijujUnG0129400 [Ziziphus jujuba var. spinosa]|uniref:Uncharacterized protein n=1 Tax=Ziziphus jujuba var. spinosa TaxID=714518 RepID=A0A978U7P7_ZIZJJ|nr:hypothetical protein FEM48_ZijujUnG0129400 [Ziziphus jujuba var. spinosa]
MNSSIVCCTAGVFASFAASFLAKNTYISENALMPVNFNSLFWESHALQSGCIGGNKWVKDVIALNSNLEVQE